MIKLKTDTNRDALRRLDMWKIHEELSVVEAALLILGLDPAEHGDIDCENPSNPSNPRNFAPIFTALKYDIKERKLKPKITVDCGHMVFLSENTDEDINDTIINSEPDWKKTTIKISDLKKWLLSKNMNPSFFFDNDSDIFNKEGKFYAPKLVAAIRAWDAVTKDETLLAECNSARQAVEAWLYDRSKEYGLLNDNGQSNKTGIEQISVVTNWEPEGGAKKKK